MSARSPTMATRVRGPFAVFTEPAFKVERVSYPVMTPSAARGLLEAILWKPAIRWHVERIRILSPIKFTAFRRNEVNSKAPAPAAATMARGGEYRPYFADDDRSQRNTIVLTNVDYVIEAHCALTERAGAEDNVQKFVEMFHRRVEKGQHFHQPYFGCREFPSDVLPADGAPEPIPDSRDLGYVLWDIIYGPPNRAVFFQARLDRGVMEVPLDPPRSTP
jgi:CRISPR-associated protein Cas5d